MAINKNQNRRPKVTKLKSKFHLFLGQLNPALNNPSQELRFAFKMEVG